jgi:hypothetical protein
VTWNAAQPNHVALHCICGLSFEGEVRSGAQAFTSAWWQVHCGDGHGPSLTPVKKPTEAEVLQRHMAEEGVHNTPHDALTGAVKDLALALRLAAEDLALCEPTDAKELDGKLRDLQELVMEGTLAVARAADAYDQVPAEPEAVNEGGRA